MIGNITNEDKIMKEEKRIPLYGKKRQSFKKNQVKEFKQGVLVSKEARRMKRYEEELKEEIDSEERESQIFTQNKILLKKEKKLLKEYRDSDSKKKREVQLTEQARRKMQEENAMMEREKKRWEEHMADMETMLSWTRISESWTNSSSNPLRSFEQGSRFSRHLEGIDTKA